MTYTLAEMQVSPATYSELRRLLENAGYTHAISSDGTLDMTHIGVTADPHAARPVLEPYATPRDLPTLEDHAERAHETAVELYRHMDMDLVPCGGFEPVTGAKSLLNSIRHDLSVFSNMVARIKKEQTDADQKEETR